MPLYTRVATRSTNMRRRIDLPRLDVSAVPKAPAVHEGSAGVLGPSVLQEVSAYDFWNTFVLILERQGSRPMIG